MQSALSALWCRSAILRSASQSSSSGRSSRSATSCSPGGRLGVGDAGSPAASRRRPGDVGKQVLERVELLISLVASLDPDPWHARDVVDGVPGEREQSTTWSGRMPHSAFRPAHVERLPACAGSRSGCGRPRSWRASLSAVQIDDVEPAFLAAAGEGGDDVVGLHALDDQHGDPEGLEDPSDHVDLGDEVVGHRGPVGPCTPRRSRTGRRARGRRRRPRDSRACGPASRLSRSRKIPKTALVGCPAGPVIRGSRGRPGISASRRRGCRSSAARLGWRSATGAGDGGGSSSGKSKACWGIGGVVSKGRARRPECASTRLCREASP